MPQNQENDRDDSNFPGTNYRGTAEHRFGWALTLCFCGFSNRCRTGQVMPERPAVRHHIKWARFGLHHNDHLNCGGGLADARNLAKGSTADDVVPGIDSFGHPERRSSS